MLSRESVVVVSTEQISCELSGEVVILSHGEGLYYGLNEVGARIWELIQTPRAVKDVVASLCEQFEVETERCEKDVLVLLEQLLSRRLIVVDDAPAT